MERMTDLEEMLRELSEKYKNSKSVEVYEEQLEGWFKIIDDLREENRKLKVAGRLYREDNKKLRAENEYLHKLLPEADGYVIEKQLEKRLWNDGEEDVYEDWGE